jgi:hypothetical protein
MRDLFLMEIVLAALLVSSFTIVGAVALWAATSPRHWFARASVVVAFLSPLLLIPAYEPFLTLSLEAAFVVAGVRAWRSRRDANNSIAKDSLATIAAGAARPKSLQFSLVTLLWLTAIAAIGVAIVTRVIKNLPPQNPQAWVTIALNGFAGSVAVLFGAWIATSKRRVFAIPAAVVLSLLLGLMLGWQDWFVGSILQQSGWPPNLAYWQQLQQWSEGLRYYLVRSAAVNVTTMLLTTLAVALTVWLWVAAAWQPSAVGEIYVARRRSSAQLAAGAACVALVLFAAAFPAAVVVELLNPLPIPRVELPNPNGYDDFVAAGKAIQGESPILNTMVEPKSTAELAAEIAKFRPAFDRIRLGLSRPCQVRAWPSGNFGKTGSILPFADIQAIRSVARALSREAELAQQQGQFADAAAIGIENMRFGQATGHGGLLINYLVAVAIEGIGQYSVYPTIPHLDPEARRKTIAALEEIEATRESLDDVRMRDRIWDENAYGWHGHLQTFLHDLTDSYGGNHENVRQNVLPKIQAINRLMIIELALRQYHSARGAWPETLSELAPKFASKIPKDPFDPEGRELRYSRTADGYLLYSLGYDRDDDGGRPSVHRAESGAYTDWQNDGDLRLDKYYEAEFAMIALDKAAAAESESNANVSNAVE